MTDYECYKCGSRITTEARTAGPFDLPPKLYCASEHEPVEMTVVD